MNACIKVMLALSCLLLIACAEQPKAAPATKPTPAPKTVAAKPASKNVQLSEDTSHHADEDGNYYVQNRVLASGGAVSGAIMGS